MRSGKEGVLGIYSADSNKFEIVWRNLVSDFLRRIVSKIKILLNFFCWYFGNKENWKESKRRKGNLKE